MRAAGDTKITCTVGSPLIWRMPILVFSIGLYDRSCSLPRPFDYYACSSWLHGWALHVIMYLRSGTHSLTSSCIIERIPWMQPWHPWRFQVVIMHVLCIERACILSGGVANAALIDDPWHVRAPLMILSIVQVTFFCLSRELYVHLNEVKHLLNIACIWVAGSCWPRTLHAIICKFVFDGR